MAEQAFVEAYRDLLKTLGPIPDKSIINTLSMLAEDNKQHAQAIVTTIEKHLHECIPKQRLPALYLMDSIIKNVREPYRTLFSKRLEHVFGRVWDSTLPKDRQPLSKLVNLWKGHLAPDVLARVQARMTGSSSSGQQAPAAVPVLQQQQQQPLAQQQQPLAMQQAVHALPHQQPQLLMQQPQIVAAPMQPMPAHVAPGGILVAPGQQLPGGFMVPMQQPVPAQQPGTVFVMGPHGLVPVAQAMPQPQPQLIPLQQQPPQHMAGGLPPVSPAHPTWQQPQLVPAQQQPQPQTLPRRSPAVHASPHHMASAGRSPHHMCGTSPQHASAPGSSARSGSPAQQAEHIAASLSSLLQGLTRSGYLNDPALKATSFDPAFIKKEHKGVIALLKAASDGTRARFRDVQFQRNKRRKAAAASTVLHSRSWYLPVNSWITGTTTLQDRTDVQQSEEVPEEEGPAPPPTVDADPAQTKCAISHEPFDSFYDQERETWVYRGVVKLQRKEAERYGVPDGSIVKVECLAEADLGSSPAALAAAAAAAGGGDDEADLAAAALAAPAAGQQQQQQEAAAAAPAGDESMAAAAAGGQEEQKHVPVAVKVEPGQLLERAAGQGDVKMDLDPAAAAAAGIKQDSSAAAAAAAAATAAAAAAAAGVKRDAEEGQQQLQQQEGTPSKKPRVSPEP